MKQHKTREAEDICSRLIFNHEREIIKSIRKKEKLWAITVQTFFVECSEGQTMPYSNEQKADMVLALGAAGGKKKKAVKIFQRWHPGTRPHPSTIVRQYEALKQYGRFTKERCRSAELSDDVRINILAFLRPTLKLASARRAGRQTSRCPRCLEW